MLRDGVEQLIPPTKVVVGDIVVIQSGAKVPADLRLIVSLLYLGAAVESKQPETGDVCDHR